MPTIEATSPKRVTDTAEALGLPAELQALMSPPYSWWMQGGIIALFSPSHLDGVWASTFWLPHDTDDCAPAVRRILATFAGDQRVDYVVAEVSGDPAKLRVLRSAGFESIGRLPIYPAMEILGWRLTQ